MKSDWKEKEAEGNGVRINRRIGFMWKIYAASETCLLVACADRVLGHLVMFLPVFLHWIHEKKCCCYQHSVVIISWLVYLVGVEKCAARQKEIGNHRFYK